MHLITLKVSVKTVSVFVFSLTFFLLAGFVYAQNAQELEIQNFLKNTEFCSDHGGVNCEGANPDGYIVCNDGTLDKSFTVYALPQCREELEEKTKEESDFLHKSGCFPPSEIGCVGSQSYRNLYNILENNGLEESDLGEIHLSLCREEINQFENLNQQYKQCLVKNSKPDFTLSGRETLPLLKFIFCPAFYGEHSQYDFEADLCLCNNGYYMSNTGQCLRETQVCSLKYGSNSYAVEGGCLCNDGYELDFSGSKCVLVGKVDDTPTNISEPNELFVPADTFIIPTNTILYEEILRKPEVVNLNNIFSSTTSTSESSSILETSNTSEGLSEQPIEITKKENFFKRIFEKVSGVFKSILSRFRKQ